MFIYPYRMESESAKTLAKALGAKIIRLENSKFKGSKDKIVINWGNSMTNEELEKASVLNLPEAIEIASNKLRFFNIVKEIVPVPEFTTDKEEAKSWLLGDTKIIVREILNGHSGKGIVILRDPVTFENYNHSRAKLYVKYIPKQKEFRLHVVNGEVVDIQEKRRSTANANPNWEIRNHHNGFVYAREGVELPSEQIKIDAVNAVAQCGLHFGAVDVIWNNHRKIGYILEVNTAPGIENSTVDAYKKAFKKLTVNSQGNLQWVTLDEVTPASGISLSNPLAEGYHTLHDALFSSSS